LGCSCVDLPSSATQPLHTHEQHFLTTAPSSHIQPQTLVRHHTSGSHVNITISHLSLPDVSSIVPVLRPTTQFLLLAIRIPINEPLTPTTIQPEFSPSSFYPQLNYIYIALLVCFLAKVLLILSSPRHPFRTATILEPQPSSSIAPCATNFVQRRQKHFPTVLLELKPSGSKNIAVVQQLVAFFRSAPFLIFTFCIQPSPFTTRSPSITHIRHGMLKGKVLR
jgi:hypothetical protein